MATGETTAKDPLAWIPGFLGYIAANPDRPASLYSEILDELVRRGLVGLVPHLTDKGLLAALEAHDDAPA